MNGRQRPNSMLSTNSYATEVVVNFSYNYVVEVDGVEVYRTTRATEVLEFIRSKGVSINLNTQQKYLGASGQYSIDKYIIRRW